MEPVIFTPRLKLTLVTKAGKGSQELKWLHQIRSDPEAVFWSIIPRSETIEDTEKIMTSLLPSPSDEPKSYKPAYLIHAIINPSSHPSPQESTPTDFIGIVRVHSLDGAHLPLPEDLTLPASALSTTLPTEVAYMFLPKAWGKGYATEAVGAVFEACTKAKEYWKPWGKVYVRAIVNDGNPASQGVMRKTGMAFRGVYEWDGKGERVFVGGKWRERDSLHIFGKYLVE